MEEARAATAAGDVVRLHALRRSLIRLCWRLLLSSLSLLLLAAAGLYAAHAMERLPSDDVAWLALCGLLMLLSAGLPALLLRLTMGRELREAFSAAEASLRSAEADSRRHACLAELSALLQHAGNPAELACQLLSGLARSLPVQQGLCCHWDEDSQSLHALARYGADGADAAQVLVRQPELAPLLLEVARSRRPVTLVRPGARYLRISSGLGDAEPAELLMHPIEYRGRLLGVLELASLKPFGDEAGRLLQEIAPVFAICLDSLQRLERSEALLEQARGAALAGQPAQRSGGSVA